jgi:hypothetical protein
MKLKKKLKRLEARRQDYEKMLHESRGINPKAFTCPGSMKK